MKVMLQQDQRLMNAASKADEIAFRIRIGDTVNDHQTQHCSVRPRGRRIEEHFSIMRALSHPEVLLLSRRRFLQAGSAAAAAIPTLAYAGKSVQALPPAIAKLKPLAGEATPISLEERRERQTKARGLMQENS